MMGAGQTTHTATEGQMTHTATEVQRTHTATELVDFFAEAQRDGLNITWAHGVNSKGQLTGALEGKAMMLETDIIVRGHGTSNHTNIPIHAHPPQTDSDITFQEWLDRFTKVLNKGIKLDFKCIEALEPTLQVLKQRKILVPVLLNADIAEGPLSSRSPLDAKSFIDTCNKHYPSALMSLGFTTEWNAGTDATYTWEMMTDLLYKVHRLSQPVTFPIRAVYLSTSWKLFVHVLGLKSSFTITIWSSKSDDVVMTGLVALRRYGGKDRVYFDLPDEKQMERFKKALIADDSTTRTVLQSPWQRDMWFVDDAVDSLTNNFVYLSTTGALFLSRDSEQSDSQRVHSKQAYEVDKTKTHPLEISGKVQFINTKSRQTDEETQFCLYISGNDESVDSDHKNDIFAISISSSGKLQNIATQVTSTDSTLPPSGSYQFTLRNVGVGLKPVVKVISHKCPNSMTLQDSDLDNSVEVAMIGNLVMSSSSVAKLKVSFCKVGPAKDLLLEDFVVCEK